MPRRVLCAEDSGWMRWKGPRLSGYVTATVAQQLELDWPLPKHWDQQGEEDVRIVGGASQGTPDCHVGNRAGLPCGSKVS